VAVGTDHEDITPHGYGGDGDGGIGVVGGSGVPAGVCFGADNGLEGVAAERKMMCQ